MKIIQQRCKNCGVIQSIKEFESLGFNRDKKNKKKIYSPYCNTCKINNPEFVEERIRVKKNLRDKLSELRRKINNHKFLLKGKYAL